MFVVSVRADQIVQDGSLSGAAGEPMSFPILLDRFDTMGGTRQLNFVQIDASTSVIGGYEPDGSGVPVDILASLEADYFLGKQTLIESHALVQSTVPNQTGGIAVTVFDSDPQQLVISDAAGLEPWIGSSTIMLEAIATFIVTEDPPGHIFFGAGGGASYTITYDFDVLPDVVGDINGDGVVDGIDLGILLSNWTL